MTRLKTHLSQTVVRLGIVLTAALSTNAQAACTAQSAAERPHLVELYTSEGCSSCPPAEQWMTTLRKHADLIGLEFHVDYWDSSDWRDPFSDHAYTVRQQKLADRGNKHQIYSPQIWLDGHVWANWPKGTPPDAASAPAPQLRLSAEAADKLHVTLDADPAGPDLRVYAALTESGLSEHVRGGENRGKTLTHDEVVRSFGGPFPLPHADIDLKIPGKIDASKASLVAFVTDEHDGSVVQALRLPYEGCRK